MLANSLSAIAFLASATLVNASGWSLQNACEDQEAWVNIVQGGNPNGAGNPQKVAPQSSFPFTEFQYNPGAGMTIKIQNGSAAALPIQFEYTYSGGLGQTWFDLSAIDGKAFLEGGIMLVPSPISPGNCHGTTCCANSASSNCSTIYNVWDDDKRTGPTNPMADCGTVTDVAVVLCPNKAGGQIASMHQQLCGSSSGSGSSPPVAPPSAPASSAAPANNGQNGAAQPSAAGSSPAASSQAGSPPASSPSKASITATTLATALVETTSAGYVLEVVTEVVTTTQFPASKPSPDRVKRHLHRHAHAHDF